MPTEYKLPVKGNPPVVKVVQDPTTGNLHVALALPYGQVLQTQGDSPSSDGWFLLESQATLQLAQKLFEAAEDIRLASEEIRSGRDRPKH